MRIKDKLSKLVVTKGYK